MFSRTVSSVARPVLRQARSGANSRTLVTLVRGQNAIWQQAAAVSNTPKFTGLTERTFFGSNAASAPAISDSEVTGLFGLWNDALATLDPDTVAKRYAKTSVLLPTVSDVPRTDYDGIKSYFVDFLQKQPQGVIVESNVIQGDDYCMDAGIYEFTMGATGDKFMARYTYVYVHEDGEWKIAHHHSSIMPEGMLG